MVLICDSAAVFSLTCSGLRPRGGWSLCWILFNAPHYPARLCSTCACAPQRKKLPLSTKDTHVLYPPLESPLQCASYLTEKTKEKNNQRYLHVCSKMNTSFQQRETRLPLAAGSGVKAGAGLWWEMVVGQYQGHQVSVLNADYWTHRPHSKMVPLVRQSCRLKGEKWNLSWISTAAQGEDEALSGYACIGLYFEILELQWVQYRVSFHLKQWPSLTGSLCPILFFRWPLLSRNVRRAFRSWLPVAKQLLKTSCICLIFFSFFFFFYNVKHYFNV